MEGDKSQLQAPPDYTPTGKSGEPGLGLPEIPPTEDTVGATPPRAPSTAPSKPEDEFEALNRRFAALKKR